MKKVANMHGLILLIVLDYLQEIIVSVKRTVLVTVVIILAVKPVIAEKIVNEWILPFRCFQRG